MNRSVTRYRNRHLPDLFTYILLILLGFFHQHVVDVLTIGLGIVGLRETDHVFVVRSAFLGQRLVAGGGR